MAADDFRQARGEIPVAAAEVEHGHSGPHADPSEHTLGVGPQGRPPVAIRHRGRGKYLPHTTHPFLPPGALPAHPPGLRPAAPPVAPARRPDAPTPPRPPD